MARIGRRALAALPQTVDVAAAREASAAGRAVLIDIRESDEHALGIAPGAQRLPLSPLASRIAEIPRNADQPVLLICATQGRSGKLAECGVACCEALNKTDGFGPEARRKPQRYP